MYCTLVAYHLSVISRAQDPWFAGAAYLDATIQEASLRPIEQQSADRLPPRHQSLFSAFVPSLSAPLSFVSFHFSSSRRVMKLSN